MSNGNTIRGKMCGVKEKMKRSIKGITIVIILLTVASVVYPHYTSIIKTQESHTLSSMYSDMLESDDEIITALASLSVDRAYRLGYNYGYLSAALAKKDGKDDRVIYIERESNDRIITRWVGQLMLSHRDIFERHMVFEKLRALTTGIHMGIFNFIHNRGNRFRVEQSDAVCVANILNLPHAKRYEKLYEY